MKVKCLECYHRRRYRAAPNVDTPTIYVWDCWKCDRVITEVVGPRNRKRGRK